VTIAKFAGWLNHDRSVLDCIGDQFHTQPLSTALYLILSAASIDANGSRGRLLDLITGAEQLGLSPSSPPAQRLLEEANAFAQRLQEATSAAASLVGNVNEPDVCQILAASVNAAEPMLKRILEIEIGAASDAIHQRYPASPRPIFTTL
jgi:hypothetical protein